MPLRKSPSRTPALLAANRANAKKSTGPRTAQGKARVSLNALKHGKYAVDLPNHLVRAGYSGERARYDWFLAEITATFPGSTRPEYQRYFERLAAQAWCLARNSGRFWTKAGKSSSIKRLGFVVASGFRFRIQDRWRRLGLVFWVQRRRYWTLEKMLRAARGEEPKSPPEGYRIEPTWRRRRFRGRRVGLWERQEMEERLRRRRRAA